VPATAAAGQELEYRLCIENHSAAAAHHVVVRNPVPAGARFVRANPEPSSREPELVWRLGTLEACACKEIVLVLTPTGTEDVKNCARVQFEHGQCTTTRIARADLSLRKTGPTQGVVGDTLTFQIVVTNPGSVEATGVLVTDELPEGLERTDEQEGKRVRTWNLGTLAPGQSRVIEYRVLATKTGRLCNQAVAVATGGLRREASHCVVVGQPQLALSMKGPEQRSLARTATYQITVANSGTAPAANVVITNPVPDNAEFVAASNGGRLEAGQVRWLIGTLPPGAQRSVRVELRGKRPAGAERSFKVENRATATADRSPMVQATATTLFEGAAGLTFDIDEKEDPVEVGKPTSYTVTVVNQGSAPVTNVRIEAVVPEQMDVMDARGPTNAGLKGKRVTFEPVKTVAAGGTVSFEISVQPKRVGSAIFQVEMTADQLKGGPVTKQESTEIFSDEPAPRVPPAVKEDRP
jgi:uncharacterized repeat protein (TIGR01451 family)